MRYIISLELKENKVFHHHLLVDEDSYLFTLHTRRLWSPKDNEYVLNEIINGDLTNVVLFYKNKYKIHHRDISLSMGPMLRQYIKKYRRKRNEKSIRSIRKN